MSSGNSLPVRTSITASSHHPDFQIINAPNKVTLTNTSVFLAGSITDPDWRATISDALSHLPITILNPLRPDWATIGEEDVSNPKFRTQVTWELDYQRDADLVVMYFSKGKPNTISMLELGLAAAGRKSNMMMVCCEEGWGSRGNVQMICHRYGIKLVETLDDLVEEAKKKLQATATFNPGPTGHEHRRQLLPYGH